MTTGLVSWSDVDVLLIQEFIQAVSSQDGIASFMLGGHGKWFKLGVNLGNGLPSNPTASSVPDIEAKMRRIIDAL